MHYLPQSKRGVLIRTQRRLANAASEARSRKSKRRAARTESSKNISRDLEMGGRKTRYFPAPKEFNLSSSYENTVKFLMQFRRYGSGPRPTAFYLDLRGVQSISPAGALLLAAELHRWQLRHARKLRSRDAEEWDPTVRKLLATMGFFDLLAVASGTEIPRGEVEDGRLFLPFICGRNADTTPFIRLRDLIERTIGRISPRLLLYQGVSEAITNVLHHAYQQNNNLSRWWLSACIDAKLKRLTVMVLDHGIGIPRTLPRAGTVERLRATLNAVPFLVDDGVMIQAAVTVGRSALQLAHRGNGLQRDIQHAIRQYKGTARLRIHSNRGLYVFERFTNGTTNARTAASIHSLDGTFVEWTFDLPELELNPQMTLWQL